MSKQITMDELHIGMFFTVLRGKIERRPIITADKGPDILEKEDKSNNGRVFKITSIDRPYIVAEHMFNRKDTITYNFDLRDIIIGTISYEYVKRCHPTMEIVEREIDPDLQIGAELLAEMVPHSTE